MPPQSLPVTPMAPAKASYGFSYLDLFSVYTTRTAYLAAFGVYPPTFDSTQPIQLWFDTSATAGNYQSISDGAPGVPPVMTPFTLPPAIAARPNIPGTDGYASYAPITSTTATSQGTGTPLNPALLCHLADAETLATMVGAPIPTQAPPEGGPVNWGTDPADVREWQITVPGSSGPVDAAPLIASMYAAGIGAPGSWNISNPNVIVWVPAPAPDLTTTTVTPVPMRSLLPTESIEAGILGTYDIVNSEYSPTPAPTPSNGSALTPQQAAQLETIYAWVQAQPEA